MLTVERKFLCFGFMPEAVLITQRCNVLVITEQCLNNIKDFSTHYTTPSTGRLRCTRIWEETARTDDPN